VNAVVHVASLKSVAESMRDPLKYLHVNVVGTLNLLKCCEQARYFSISLFSSLTLTL